MKNLVILFVVGVWGCTTVNVYMPVRQGQPIPKEPFTSWSLFLICNPQWLHPQNADDLAQLFEWYKAFGAAAGPKHAAAWFFTHEAGPQAGQLDVQRNAVHCQKLGLLPSESPFVVVTTTHPDEPGAQFIAKLGFAGKSSREIGLALTKLTDQLAAGNVSQQELESAQYAFSWLEALHKACSWLDKVSVSVSVRFIKIDRTGICG